MKMKSLGPTALRVSEIGFGTWAIGGDSYGRTDDSVSTLAIEESLNLGCNFFDTADVYGNGHSETILGRSLRTAGRLNDVVIATKGGLLPSDRSQPFDFSVAGIIRSAQHSLQRLGRDFIDIYQLHNPPLEVLKSGEVYQAMLDLNERGLVRYCGVSILTLAEARAAIAWNQLSTLQMTYNLLHLMNPEMSLEQLEPLLRGRNIGLIAREPLASGFLSGRHNIDTVYGESDRRREWPPALRSQRIALVNALRPMERPGASLAQIAIRFALDQPLVGSVVVGIKTPAQAKENFAAANLPCFDEFATSALSGN